MKKIIYILLSIFIFNSCTSEMDQSQVEGCWTVAYIDTDGVKDKGGDYEMCFESNGVLISQKKDGTQKKIEVEWNLEEKDSTIVVHYSGKSMPDTMKISKLEDEEMHLQLKKKYSVITIYLRKEK